MNCSEILLHLQHSKQRAQFRKCAYSLKLSKLYIPLKPSLQCGAIIIAGINTPFSEANFDRAGDGRVMGCIEHFQLLMMPVMGKPWEQLCNNATRICLELIFILCIPKGNKAMSGMHTVGCAQILGLSFSLLYLQSWEPLRFPTLVKQ